MPGSQVFTQGIKRQVFFAALLQELLRLNTVNPPGNETAAAELLREHLESAGLSCELYARTPERANLVARLPGRGEGPSLLLLSHTDTVVADPSEWTVDPWSGVVRDAIAAGVTEVNERTHVSTSAFSAAEVRFWRARGVGMFLSSSITPIRRAFDAAHRELADGLG